MNKRWIAMCTAATCCAAALAACGDDSGDDGDHGPTAGLGAAGTISAAGGGGTAGGAGNAGRTGGGGTTGTAGSVAGSGGTAGTAGAAGGDNDAGIDDEDAGPPPDLDANMARAMIAPFGTGTVMGSATFTQNGIDVTVEVALTNCPDGAHPVHIHQGTSCADANAQGMHWDMTRGEGIPDVNCQNGTGMVVYTRPGTPGSLAWSVQGSATTNVIGHAFVVHAANSDRIGCGVIAGQP